MKLPKPVEITSVMPDLRGMPKRLLLPLLVRTDITVELRGSGYVVAQEPAPGAAVKPGAVITLELQ